MDANLNESTARADASTQIVTSSCLAYNVTLSVRTAATSHSVGSRHAAAIRNTGITRKIINAGYAVCALSLCCKSSCWAQTHTHRKIETCHIAANIVIYRTVRTRIIYHFHLHRALMMCPSSSDARLCPNARDPSPIAFWLRISRVQYICNAKQEASLR